MGKHIGLALAAAAVLSAAACTERHDERRLRPRHELRVLQDLRLQGRPRARRIPDEARRGRDREVPDRQGPREDGREGETKPDLWVVLHARLKNDKQITSYNSGWGWGWGWGWRGWGGGGGISTARIYDVPVGTLVVDLVDTKEKELVWRGFASRDVSSSETPQERAEITQKAVDKLFEGFPPKH